MLEAIRARLAARAGVGRLARVDKRSGGLIEGHVERIADGRIEGWAFDPTRPDRPVELEMLLHDGDRLAARQPIPRRPRPCRDRRRALRLYRSAAGQCQHGRSATPIVGRIAAAPGGLRFSGRFSGDRERLAGAEEGPELLGGLHLAAAGADIGVGVGGDWRCGRGLVAGAVDTVEDDRDVAAAFRPLKALDAGGVGRVVAGEVVEGLVGAAGEAPPDGQASIPGRKQARGGGRD